MAPSKSSAYATINELNESKTSGKIKARVSRLWEVTNPYVQGHLICIDMVLIDEEGGYVHATIYGNSLIERFRSRLTEGDVYVMNHFAIESNKSLYRVVSESKIMLKFQFSTCIKKIASGNVYGVLMNESVEKDSTAIEIRDKSENIIKLKLWRHFSADYNEQMKEYRASMKLDTSSSSKVYINLDFPEINELKSLLRKPKTVNKGFFYEYCTKSVEKSLTVYRLELLVKDASGATILTMFNDEAKMMDPSSEDYDFIPSLL
ncbi:uncharacterized protein LOC141601279 [Silene latifolia]|uniref:uncharacterized protein LOC141601279 n=1 Tax=Silene latifolia TaxID=37657 RepID=UPI003D77E521